MTTKEYTIEGMSCQHCVMAVKKEISKIGGVHAVEVIVGKATVQFDEAVTDTDIAAAVEEAGYTLVA